MSAAIDVESLLLDDFWRKVKPDSVSGCWLWQQSCGSHGYGQTWDGRTVLLAHRVAWTLSQGPIPDGLTIDHLCYNRRCCNPSHMRLLTLSENARCNGQRLKTQCPRGHPYDGDNLYVDPKGHRRCRECKRILRLA